MASKTIKTPHASAARFAPLCINWNELQSEQMINLYKFAHLLFPGFTSPGMLKTLLNLENEMQRVLLNIPQEVRDEIQESLKGIGIDIKIVVTSEEVGEIISLPLNIEPAAIMQRAILGKGPVVDLEGQLSEMKKGLFTFITKEGARMMRESLQGFFKKKVREGVVGPVKDLVQAGAITNSGKIKRDTTIEDLLVGKYAPLFSKVANREVVNAGLAIEQTLLTLYELGELDVEDWATTAHNDMELIKLSLQEMKS